MKNKIIITFVLIILLTSITGCIDRSDLRTKTNINAPKEPQTYEEKYKYLGQLYYNECRSEGKSENTCGEYASKKARASLESAIKELQQ